MLLITHQGRHIDLINLSEYYFSIEDIHRDVDEHDEPIGYIYSEIFIHYYRGSELIKIFVTRFENRELANKELCKIQKSIINSPSYKHIFHYLDLNSLD